MSFTLTFGQEGNCATAQVVWSVDGKTYRFRSDNNFVAWISTIFTVADVVNGGGGDLLILSDQLPPVQGGVGNLWAEYGTTSSVVGNSRGEGAVDWQQSRNLATQIASGDFATVGGGQYNTASQYNSTVAGGYNNTASNLYATVGGGADNTASNLYATVGGGADNTASGIYSTVGGGKYNTASNSYATVGGGRGNTASNANATVGGGYNNTASNANATVGGGEGNNASQYASTVGGGRGNTASGTYATVAGGRDNTASNTNATVGGGYNNTASNTYATVGGGEGNTASGIYSTVGGGRYNTASDTNATVAGGYNNTALNTYATMGGGRYNTASGISATVGGGEYNTTSTNLATVSGGNDNEASAIQSFISGGGGALASRRGMMAHASGYFSDRGDAQAVEFVARNSTTGGSSILFLDGAIARFAVRNNTLLSGICTISGFSYNGSTVGLYQRSISIKNVGGTTALIHLSTISTDHEDNPAWSVTITADNATDSLNILCNSSGDDARWVAVFRGLEIGMP